MIFCPPPLCDSTFRRAKCPRHPALYCLLSALHSCVFTLVENCHHLTFWLQRLHHNTTTYSTTGVSCMLQHALFMLFTPDNNSKITILWFMNVPRLQIGTIEHYIIVPECFCTSCFLIDSFSLQNRQCTTTPEILLFICNHKLMLATRTTTDHSAPPSTIAVCV